MFKTIFQTVKHWVLGIEQDVESIVSSLHNMVDELVDHQVKKTAEAFDLTDAANELKAKAAEARAEAAKAGQVADKIKDLVS